MIGKEEAGRIAIQYLASKGSPEYKDRLLDVRWLSNWREWVCDFALPDPPDGSLDSPGMFMVIVDGDSGETRVFESL